MKTIIMLLAYNAEKTLAKTVQAIPDHLKPNILVGDDCSSDRTSQVAKELGLEVVRHDKNLNYGGNLRSLMKHAISAGADVVVELHADYQYEPSIIDLLAGFVERGWYDLIQGNRIRTRQEALSGGMPYYRYFGNRVLTFGQNLWFGTCFGEWHSGLRAYSRRLLVQAPLEEFHSSHAFASDIMSFAVARGFRVAEVPCPVRYDIESSSVAPGNLFRYAWHTIRAALRYPPWRRARSFLSRA
jgi:glycosyltransferase involved in cell wall biosynthesis